nr:PREDICTED: uncharacterized protein LOC102359927 isoform X1 [Latimeria chalumnae]|eukprot:XP_014353339.1 PREDICTED: uncharacterized protein LOC102359927 isoform X1 [Latimeria chalumnae]
MTLRTVFGTAGPIYGIRMLYDRYCAFVNFGSKEAAEKAFDTLQGLEVDGTKLVLQLKHPDHAAKTAGGLKPTAAATAVPAPAPPASNRYGALVMPRPHRSAAEKVQSCFRRTTVTEFESSHQGRKYIIPPGGKSETKTY